MPNTFFQFKQFTINQDKCAMKVCTDTCLFGAWVAEKIEIGKCKVENWKSPSERFWAENIENKDGSFQRILDIGTGTGLLSLMLAQKTDFEIEAVEMDVDATTQASENVNASPWANQIKVHHSTIQQFNPSTQYDFIISNPPFYDNDLKGPNPQKNLAHHSQGLSLQEMMENVTRLLKPEGEFAILLPAHRADGFIKMANGSGFYLQEMVQVKQTEKHVPFRSMLWFSNKETSIVHSEITIKIDDKYSEEFVTLLKPYYLYL